MSTIVLSCPGCGKRYELSGSLAGKKARCKACSQEFSIPVPRQVSTPSTTSAPARPKTSAPARAPAPPPPPVLDQFDAFEDIEDHSAAASSVSYDDDETYLPPRAGTPVRAQAGGESKPKKKKKKRGSGTSPADWAGMIPLIAIGMVVVLTVIGLIIPPFPFLGLLIIILCGLAMIAGGGIWIIVNAFRESAVCGVLFMFMPFYGLYYLATRWDDMAKPFGIYLVGILMVAIVPQGYIAAGMLPGFGAGAGQQDLNNPQGADGVGFVPPPHVGFQANRPARVNQDNANFAPPPTVGMPTNNGMPNGMPAMPANNGMPPMSNMPPSVPRPPNFGPGGPGGMNNFPARPNNLPGPFGPGRRFGRPGGMPGQR